MVRVPHMCSQADDPSQHVGDDTLRAALDAAIEAGVEVGHDGWENRDKAWAAFRTTLAASATDERTIPCYSCGERLPVDPVIVQRHVNERHPEVVGPGVNRNARSLAAPATDEPFQPKTQAALGRWADSVMAVPATDEPQHDGFSSAPMAARLAASATDEHVHHWTDAPDDEEGWYCPSCGVTEYPNGSTLAASATDENDEPPSCAVLLRKKRAKQRMRLPSMIAL